jgi:adenine-specific DNA methylase
MALEDGGAFPWALSKVIDAYEGLCKLVDVSQPLFQTQNDNPSKSIHIDMANATNLNQFADGTVDAVVVDPPYGDNVMYAELSDFFYVWLKRSVGDLYPDWFKTGLTEKHTEAVANPAQFKSAKGKPKELATRDYLLKMRRAFREMRRVVKPDGSMVVMFTHKETDMWNALGLALLETDWQVGASWPVHTESEHSLHQARMNAAKSTILLFCHPRIPSSETTYFDQAIRQEVRSTARSSAQRYQEAGIDGVDLYLATYGPVLGVLSKSWPILSTEVDRETGEQKRLEPEEALNIARREVFDMRKEQLVQGRPGNWDAVTEWYILAWDAARTREVSFDVAHKLALSSGIDAAALINQHRILAKKGDTVRFLEPKERFGEGRVDPAATSFSRLIDVLHTALYLYQEESDRACRRFLDTTGHLRDPDFSSLVEAALNAIPRTRRYERGKVVGFLLPEAQTLENMRVSMFPDIEAPHEVIHEVGEQRAFDLDEDEDEEE